MKLKPNLCIKRLKRYMNHIQKAIVKFTLAFFMNMYTWSILPKTFCLRCWDARVGEVIIKVKTM